MKTEEKEKEKEKRVKVKTFSRYPDEVTHLGTNRAQLAWLWVNFHVHVFAILTTVPREYVTIATRKQCGE